MKKHFITGLIILLPLAVTLAIAGFVINFLTTPFMDLASRILSHLHVADKGFFFLSPQQVVRYGSQILILSILFSLTICLGMVTRWFFIRTLLRMSDRLLHRIPLINTVYKTSQEIIKTLFSADKNSFKQVVMVPFPHSHTYALGLIARESPQICSQAVQEELISVLIPTTPNPTTGFLMMYRKQDLVYVDMKPEEAIKYIVSCGVIIPEASSRSTLPFTSL